MNKALANYDCEFTWSWPTGWENPVPPPRPTPAHSRVQDHAMAEHTGRTIRRCRANQHLLDQAAALASIDSRTLNRLADQAAALASIDSRTLNRLADQAAMLSWALQR